MHLFLDIAMNHIRDTHPWFLKALQKEQRFKDFFTFKEDGKYQCWRAFKNFFKFGQGENYLCWHDFRHMPELN